MLVPDEGAGVDELERQRRALAVVKPGDLVIEGVLGLGVANGAREIEQLVGRREAVLDHERVPVGIALAVDVEVPERDQVSVELVLVIGVVSHPRREARELGGPKLWLVAFPVLDVQGDQGEGLVSGPEADRVGSPIELLVQNGLVLVELLVGNHQLARQARGPCPFEVEEVAEALVVSLLAAGDVGDDEAPAWAEDRHQ